MKLYRKHKVKIYKKSKQQLFKQYQTKLYGKQKLSFYRRRAAVYNYKKGQTKFHHKLNLIFTEEELDQIMSRVVYYQYNDRYEIDFILVFTDTVKAELSTDSTSLKTARILCFHPYDDLKPEERFISKERLLELLKLSTRISPILFVAVP